MKQSRNKKAKKSSAKNRFSPVQKIIFSVIITAMAIIIIMVICIPLLKSENIIKTKIDSLANYYYEEYFYENLINSKNFSGDAEKTLENYKDKGIARVLLRQLVSRSPEELRDNIKTIEEACNKDKTYVVFYPDPPYERTSYHKEYSYSCNF